MQRQLDSCFDRLSHRGFHLVLAATLLAAVLTVGIFPLRTSVAHAASGCSNWYINGTTQWYGPVYATPHINTNMCSDGTNFWIGSWGPDCPFTGDGTITITWCGAPGNGTSDIQLGANWTETFTDPFPFGVTFTCQGWYRWHVAGWDEGGLSC